MFIRNTENTDPTPKEIKIILSSEIDAYVAEGFDPSKKDANTKWNRALGHTKNTEILVLNKKIFGKAYEPYIASKHSTNADDYKSITKPVTVNYYRTARSNARGEYNRWLEKNNPTALMSPEPQIPTQAEIDILFSPGIDAYLAEGFDPSKRDANEKHDSTIHNDDVKILVLSKKIFGKGYEPYIPSQHGTNEDDYKPVTINNYRCTRTAARNTCKKWLANNNTTNTNIATLSILGEPTQSQIDFLTSNKKLDAYVAKTFDPSKGDDNEKYNSRHHSRDDKILVLKKKIFGYECQPYIPSLHGANPKSFTSMKVKSYSSERSRAKKAYKLWEKNNPSFASTTTSATNITSTTTSTTTSLSNHVVGPKRFNPIILIGDSKQVSETKEQETDNSVAASQTSNAPQQRKRAADDGVSSSPPFFITRNVLTLFQNVDEPVVPKDPTEPKRLRLND